MLKQRERQTEILAVALATVFTIGLILGAVALYYAPKNAVKDAAEAIVVTNELSFYTLFKKNLLFELLWLLLIWISGISSVTAPLMAAVVALRGFVIGFTVSFVFKGELNPLKLFLCSILPQCLVALPVLSIFVITCSQSYDKRNSAAPFQPL